MRLAGPAQRRQQPGTSPDQAVASRPAPGRESTRPGAGRHLRRRLEIALFVSPALLLYLVFVLLPIVLAAYYSVFHWNGLDPLNDFVGLDNYRRAFGDEAFRKAITHNGILVVLSLVIQGPRRSAWRCCSTGACAGGRGCGR